jgi:hypothetical protein
MVIATARQAPVFAGGAAGAKRKGIRMALPMKIGLVAIMVSAMSCNLGHAQSSDGTGTDPTSTPGVDPALAQGGPNGVPYQYGVFRETAASVPANQKNCWVQGLVSGQTINGDLLTERVTVTQAQCVLTYLTNRGLCANQRTSPYWSARQDDTSNGGWNNPNNQGSGNWGGGWNNPNNNQGSGNSGNGNGWQGGGGWNNANNNQDSGNSGNANGWQSGGGWHQRRQWWQGGGSQNNGDTGNGDQWTRQSDWMQNGGMNSAWINKICGGGTGGGSNNGTGTATASGPTSN